MSDKSRISTKNNILLLFIEKLRKNCQEKYRKEDSIICNKYKKEASQFHLLSNFRSIQAQSYDDELIKLLSLYGYANQISKIVFFDIL